MSLKQRNPGGQAGASPIAPLCIKSQRLTTTQQRQAQLLARRFGLPLWTARNIAFLAFGGGNHE
jgi:hypothetical protein